MQSTRTSPRNQPTLHTQSWTPVSIPHPAKPDRVGSTLAQAKPRRSPPPQWRLDHQFKKQVLLQRKSSPNPSCPPRILSIDASLIYCRRTWINSHPNCMTIHRHSTTPNDRSPGSGSKVALPPSPSTPPLHPPMKSEPWDCLMIQIPRPFPFPSLASNQSFSIKIGELQRRLQLWHLAILNRVNASGLPISTPLLPSPFGLLWGRKLAWHPVISGNNFSFSLLF